MNKAPSLFLKLIADGYQRFIETQQVRMSSNVEGLPLLAALGIICGLLAGGLIVLFRLAVDHGSYLILGDQNLQGFDQLSGTTRLLLCIFGALLVGVLLHLLKPKDRLVGIVHVLERLDYHQGRLPIKNAIVQFAAACISLLSGQSVGREGPSVHLGATSGSQLGRLLRVPNNSTRILIACGTAAAIAAAFGTPLAGVIFAMEVVLMEYSVIGFTPVILASVSAATLTAVTIGKESIFKFPVSELQSLYELPLVAVMGAVIGVIAALFIRLTLLTSSVATKQSIWARCALAGLITGLIAYQFPQIMGIGYDTINELLLVEIGLGLALLILVAKLFATSMAIGLGIPAGLIGPTLFIGAAAGSIMGIVVDSLLEQGANAGIYTMLGMAAMMAATLQAPLAALIYLLELSSSQSIILPGMAAVITASLVTRVVFGKSSIYRHIMLARGLDHRNSPLSNALRRIGIASIMDRNIQQQPRYISAEQADAIIKQEPRWILLAGEDMKKASLLPATDLARYLNELEQQPTLQQELQIDLKSIPAKRIDTAKITIIATLQEAHERMQAEQCSALFISGAYGGSKNRIYGVVTREHIERSYRA